MNSQRLYEYLIKLRDDLREHHDMLYSRDHKYKAIKMKIKAKYENLKHEWRLHCLEAHRFGIELGLHINGDF